jgi:hypothetical protein
MDQSLKTPGQSALEDAFHAMFELSRTAPAPTLEQRLDRLARLRAVVFNRLADLYPPYGAKIARLEKLMRFLS